MTLNLNFQTSESEQFNSDKIARRILGLGDIVGLVEKPRPLPNSISESVLGIER